MVAARDELEAAVFKGGVVYGGPGGDQVHRVDVDEGLGVLVPGLGGSDGRRLHEQLVGVELEVIGVEQVGDDVNDGGIAGVALQDVVLAGQPVELADFELAGGGRGFAFANDSFGLNTLWTRIGFAAGDLVGALAETRDVVR